MEDLDYKDLFRDAIHTIAYTAGKAIAKGANLARQATLIAGGEPR